MASYRGRYTAQHLTAEFWGCAPSLLADADALASLLSYVVIEAGMRPVGAPTKLMVADGEAAWGTGASAMQLLLDSNASIHGLVERRHAYLDLFSCKPFDGVDRLVCDVAGALRATGWRWRIEDRTIGGSWWRRLWSRLTTPAALPKM